MSNFDYADNLLSNSRFFELLGVNPYLANQIDTSGAKKCCNGCGSAAPCWFRYAWQGTPNHESLSATIASVEAMLRDELGCSILPEYKCKTVALESGRCTQHSFDICLEDDCNVELGGPKKYYDLGEFEIEYIYKNDRLCKAKILIPLGLGAHHNYRLTVPCNGQTLTCKSKKTILTSNGKFEEICFHPWDLIDPEIYDCPSILDMTCSTCDLIDGSDIDNYLETIKVERAVLDWREPLVEFIWWGDPNLCGCGSCEVCVKYCAPGCGITLDGRMGEVRISYAEQNANGDWISSGACPQVRSPDAVRVKYWAYPYADDCKSICDTALGNEVSRQYETIVKNLVAARVPYPHCLCHDGTLITSAQQDTAITTTEESYYIDNKVKTFGTRRGELDAFKDFASMLKGIERNKPEPELCVVLM